MRVASGIRLKYLGCIVAVAIAAGSAPTAASIAAPVQTATLDQPYRLGPGDRLHVTVYNEPAFSGDFSITDAGAISLPLVGDVKASGLSVVEFQKLATKILADGYINNPKISVEVLIYRPFYILGEVNKPGQYPFAPGMTVFNAVAAASGFTYRGNKSLILVRHEGEEGEHEVRLDATTMVLPGDTIRIKERHF